MIEMNVDKILQVSYLDRNHQSPLELGLQSPLIMLYVLIARSELLNSIIGVCVCVCGNEVCEWPPPSNDEVSGAGSSLHVLHGESTPGCEDDGLFDFLFCGFILG